MALLSALQMFASNIGSSVKTGNIDPEGASGESFARFFFETEMVETVSSEGSEEPHSAEQLPEAGDETGSGDDISQQTIHNTIKKVDDDKGPSVEEAASVGNRAYRSDSDMPPELSGDRHHSAVLSSPKSMQDSSADVVPVLDQLFIQGSKIRPVALSPNSLDNAAHHNEVPVTQNTPFFHKVDAVEKVTSDDAAQFLQASSKDASQRLSESQRPADILKNTPLITSSPENMPESTVINSAADQSEQRQTKKPDLVRPSESSQTSAGNILIDTVKPSSVSEGGEAAASGRVIPRHHAEGEFLNTIPTEKPTSVLPTENLFVKRQVDSPASTAVDTDRSDVPDPGSLPQNHAIDTTERMSDALLSTQGRSIAQVDPSSDAGSGFKHDHRPMVHVFTRDWQSSADRGNDLIEPNVPTANLEDAKTPSRPITNAHALFDITTLRYENVSSSDISESQIDEQPHIRQQSSTKGSTPQLSMEHAPLTSMTGSKLSTQSGVSIPAPDDSVHLSVQSETGMESRIEVRTGTAPLAVPPSGTTIASPPPTVQSATQQLAQAIEFATGDNVEVQLAPKELGKVRMVLQGGEQTMTVLIFAERGETLDLMRRNADLLSRDLRDLGYADVNLSFAGHGHQKDQRETGEQFDLVETDMALVPEQSSQQSLRTHTALVKSTSTDNLDLRM
ncbi:flagellar hook-length control protein FliK [Rhodobacteraceae bacterium]|nr:flagellar hook-length control protein FliK [Paracoccaceae bacterium]